MKKQINKLCPCGSNNFYNNCCGRFISAGKSPSSAGELMRSRYTAYVLQNKKYILDTWHISSRPKKFNLDLDIDWIGLQVIDTVNGQPGDEKGSVLFEATYKYQNKIYIIRENADFLKENEKWLYFHGNQSKMTVI